jgi:4-amino-4-deoxy-L-arabinose transferase-like glycosyltransferase
VLLVGFAALALRVAYVMLVKRYDRLVGDEPYFHLTANWLTEGFGFTATPHSGIPSALHPPLYSLVLAPATWISSGAAILAQRLTGAVLGAGAVVAVGYLGRAVGGARTGIIAAAVAAVSPTIWINDGVVMSESLATLLVAIGLLLTYRYARLPTFWNAAWLGAVCGLAALTRGELILLVPLLGLAAVWRGHVTAGAPRVAGFACVVAAALVVLAPWVAFNLSRFEQPVYVSSNLGGTLCGANNRLTYGGSELGLWDRSGCPTPSTRPVDQSELNDFWTTQSVDYTRNHVSRLLLVAVARLARITGVYAPGQMVAFEAETGGRPRVASWFAYGVSLLLVPVGAYGYVVLRRRRAFVAPLVMMVAMALLVALLLHGDVRYRVPADVALVVLAAAAVDALIRPRPAPPSVGGSAAREVPVAAPATRPGGTAPTP